MTDYWVNAGGLKKETSSDVATALVMIWADTANNQLYIFTGSMTLVDPTSDGLLTGAKRVVITGKDEVNYTVLQTEVPSNVVAIYSYKTV